MTKCILVKRALSKTASQHIYKSTGFFLSADHFALNASLPPAFPHRPGRRPVQCPLECFPDLYLPWDFLHSGYCLPEHQGQYLFLQTNANCWLKITHYRDFNRIFVPLQITKLKIDHNPFAKGFRDEGTTKKRWVLMIITTLTIPVWLT